MKLVAAALMLASAAAAQSLRGRAITDSSERPIPGVTVSIEALGLSTTTDSLGNFVLNGIKPGAYNIMARKIGFGPVATRIRFSAGATVEADLIMRVGDAQTLPDVKVETRKTPAGKMGEFEERRLAGNGGRFLTQADLEKRPFSTTGDAIRQLPGLDVLRSRVGMVVVNTRDTQRQQACPAAVVLDGAFVFGTGGASETPFNINNIPPNQIAGIEYYAGAASIPSKWGATRHTCGLIAIWTK